MMTEHHFDEIQMKEDWQLQFIQKIILYRMDCVNTLHYALRLRSEWTDPPPMVIFVDGELVLEGNLNAFSNPAIEAGLIHFRALLEFLGLAEKDGMLTNRTRHKNGEIVSRGFDVTSQTTRLMPLTSLMMRGVARPKNPLSKRK
jgi:hypothetical protein